MGDPLIALTAIAVELALGYPDWLYRRIGHPVSWMGALLGLLETRLNRDSWTFAARRAAGIAALLILLLCTGGVALALAQINSSSWWFACIQILVVAALIAPRNLRDHVRAVRDVFARDGLAAGRKAVSRIVGRDPEQLDESGVGRAAIESLAENFSDGVVAPLLWYLVGGLVGIVLYKAINTADSMIGHRNARYEAFGWAAARLDDLVNLPASRLTALLIAAAALSQSPSTARRSIITTFRDAPRHRSPNAGWPEAAMAGALGVALGGPRLYGGDAVDGAWLGDGSRTATAKDITRALALYDRALVAIMLMLVAFALIRL